MTALVPDPVAPRYPSCDGACPCCGQRARLFPPYHCEECLRGTLHVRPLAAGEVGYRVVVDGHEPTGPMRSRDLAEQLAAVWRGPYGPACVEEMRG